MEPRWNYLETFPDFQTASTIPSVEAAALNEERFLESHVNRHAPCLIKGAVRHWPAVEKWRDAQYLTAKCADARVLASRDVNRPYGRQSIERMPWGRFIESAFNPAIPYLCAPTIDLLPRGQFRPLLEDVGGFPFAPHLPPSRLYARHRVFIYRGCYTDWHHHPTDETLMCQLVGSKWVGLLPPDQNTWNNVFSAFKKEEHLRGNFHPTEKLPLACARVDAGDALYIPPFWWHGVQACDGQFGVTLAQTFATPWHLLADLGVPAFRNAMFSLGREWLGMPWMPFALPVTLLARRLRNRRAMAK
jgi:hypothetical protein